MRVAFCGWAVGCMVNSLWRRRISIVICCMHGERARHRAWPPLWLVAVADSCGWCRCMAAASRLSFSEHRGQATRPHQPAIPRYHHGQDSRRRPRPRGLTLRPRIPQHVAILPLLHGRVRLPASRASSRLAANHHAACWSQTMTPPSPHLQTSLPTSSKLSSTAPPNLTSSLSRGASPLLTTLMAALHPS